MGIRPDNEIQMTYLMSHPEWVRKGDGTVHAYYDYDGSGYHLCNKIKVSGASPEKLWLYARSSDDLVKVDDMPKHIFPPIYPAG